MGTTSQPTGKHHGGKGARLDDEYMMMTYKVIPCSRVSTHNWKLCHFSHVGEVTARRRHPSCHQADLCAYVSANKECPDGDKCPYAHNAFESWLHPDRFKTTMCSYGSACTRKFCFFAHSASELRQPGGQQHFAAAAAAAAASGAARTAELRLPKAACSLDTNPSIGTPNSSSSNMSSSSTHAMQAGWGAGSPMAVTVSNSVAAAAAAAAGMYVQQLQPRGGTATGIPVSSSLGGGTYLPMYQAAGQQQQQLMTAFMDSSNNSSLLTNGPPGLSAILVTAPQLAAAGSTAAATAAAPMQIGNGFAGNAAGMQFGWDSLALTRLASLGTPMATDSTFNSNSLLFDPNSPSTPLTVASLSPAHSPVAAGNAPGNGSGSLQIGSLQHAIDSSSQQQHDAQLRQQLLQHLMLMQQQKQPQQQQNGQVDVGSNWSLASIDLSVPMMLSLNQQPPQQANVGAAQDWCCGSQSALQQDQQQQAFAGMDVQVVPGPQGFKPVPQVSAGQLDLGCGLTVVAGPAAPTAAATTAAAAGGVAINGASNAAGPLGAGPASAQQLQQQLNMLSFAMPQPT